MEEVGERAYSCSLTIKGASEARTNGQQAGHQGGHEVFARSCGNDGVVGARHSRAVVSDNHEDLHTREQ